METSPSISVLTAVHNGEQFLAEAIDSILGQSFGDFEFIIVDDGSTDRSPAILNAYAARDGRIRLISQANQGLTRSLNTALGLVRAEFVARFDADDISMADRFERQVAELRARAALVLLGSEVEMITHDGLRLGVKGLATGHCEIRRRLLVGDGGGLSHPAVMMRRSALEAIGGYDETFAVAQDLDLFLRLSEVGEVGNLPQTLLLWRQHAASINRTRSHLWVSLKRRAIENTIRRIGAAAYAQGLFFEGGEAAAMSDPLDAAAHAEWRGRYRTAARLYAQELKEPGRRGAALRRLVKLVANRAVGSL